MRIAFVSDYFFPKLGGVEMHIWSLSQELLALGHHVIVISHASHDRVGIRIMSNFLKVYYLPFPLLFSGIPFPGVFHSLPFFRDIFLRENIQIIHGHQSTSTIMHEAFFHGKLLGLRTVFTEHSLYEFGDFGSIHLNKLLKFSLSTCDICVGVSDACRLNLIFRASLPFEKVVTIYNAVDSSRFQPKMEAETRTERVTIIVISRLAYRKGVDLVARVVPLVCQRFPEVDFVIGGDGPKRLVLDEMIEQHSLHDRVRLVGEVPSAEVRNLLIQGTIFLNCSLTESFCIAILEAACAGLMVVSTKVGGIPEVLPKDMICFPDSNTVCGLVDAVAVALAIGPRNPMENHHRIAQLYSWQQVALETLDMYSKVMMKESSMDFIQLIERYSSCGTISGLFAMWALGLNAILLHLLEWWRPAFLFESVCLLLDTKIISIVVLGDVDTHCLSQIGPFD